MKCKECGKDNQFKVVDTRKQKLFRRRRYVCTCGNRITTYEMEPENIWAAMDRIQVRIKH